MKITIHSFATKTFGIRFDYKWCDEQFDWSLGDLLQSVTDYAQLKSGDVLEISALKKKEHFLIKTTGFEKISAADFKTYKSLSDDARAIVYGNVAHNTFQK